MINHPFIQFIAGPLVACLFHFGFAILAFFLIYKKDNSVAWAILVIILLQAETLFNVRHLVVPAVELCK